MIIAVASGKGGTGKTTVATSLALSLAAPAADHLAPVPPLFLDCDVEAPNAHLYLKPAFERRHKVGILIAAVDAARCSGCGKCAEVCQFHAIAVMGKRTLVFPELCHGCGSCTLICPEGAIHETPNVIGVLEGGSAASGITFTRGVLNVGEPMAVPVIRELKQWAQPAAGQDVILDAPPGTSCPVVESVRGANFLLLVTEPTPFGLHDLRLAAEVARELAVPSGVVINRDGIGDSQVEVYCQSAGIPIFMRIPYQRAIAQGVAQGQTLTEIYPEYVSHLQRLYRQIVERVTENDPH